MYVINISAQTFENNFLGEDFILYKDVLFKLKEDAKLGFDYTFYNNLKHCQNIFDNNVIYPEKEYTFNTKKDSLKNRIFKVENIIGKDGKAFKRSSYFDKPIFILRDTLNKQIIYYKYDMENEFNFPFLTSQIDLNIDELCKKLERKVDDFTDEIKIHSPIIDGGNLSRMIVYKIISKNESNYYLGLYTQGITVNVGEKDAIILFDDGTKMYSQTEIKVEAGKKGFNYSTLILLTQPDIETLITKKIKKFRLFIHDQEINPIMAEKFKVYVKCIVEAQ